MFFRFFRYILPHFTFRVFFRRIFYSNLKKVPLDKPLLFVGNHQNSFLDGILVGSYLPQPINFTMRADMFRKRLASFCLREFNVSPVYRIEEGLENVHKNAEAFTGIYEVLRRNGNFIMFSEGTCVQEKRLQKLRKGTARLAFGAEQKYGLDVHVVPVGINYTYPNKFRQEVMINFHESFTIKDFKDVYREHPARALLIFNEKCEKGLREEVIIIEDQANDWLAEQLLRMVRNRMIFPFFKWRFNSDERRQLEKNLADKINHLSRTSPDETQKLREMVLAYTGMLSSSGLKDENLARKLDWGTLRYIALVAGFPLFLGGYASNLIPFILPKYICDKLIKDPRFYSSVYISSGTLLYLIYFPVLFFLAAILAGWMGVFLSLSVPVAGYLALFYQEITRERLNTLRFNIKSVTKPGLVEMLRKQRGEILALLDNIKP
jgi:1-acyl-sn-glycerol-3-phosphate acyltransferase